VIPLARCDTVTAVPGSGAQSPALCASWRLHTYTCAWVQGGILGHAYQLHGCLMACLLQVSCSPAEVCRQHSQEPQAANSNDRHGRRNCQQGQQPQQSRRQVAAASASSICQQALQQPVWFPGLHFNELWGALIAHQPSATTNRRKHTAAASGRRAGLCKQWFVLPVYAYCHKALSFSMCCVHVSRVAPLLMHSHSEHTVCLPQSTHQAALFTFQELLESPHLTLELVSLMETLPKNLDTVSHGCDKQLLGEGWGQAGSWCDLADRATCMFPSAQATRKDNQRECDM
jgi:hypothetical protein